MRFILILAGFVLAVFAMPALGSLAWWTLQDRPASWRKADWGSSGLLPDAGDDADAQIYVMAARTGGLKGAFSIHSWIVTKAPGAASYERYDKVGWGSPIRRNGYPADGRWYSNTPWIVHRVSGRRAEQLLPLVERAIAAYPYAGPGDYRAWPGPNSNSFVAHVVASVPELGTRIPSNAVGRDFAPGFASVRWSPASWDFQATIGGYLGIAAGATVGLEVQFLGLVAGLDPRHLALQVPAFGTLSFAATAQAEE